MRRAWASAGAPQRGAILVGESGQHRTDRHPEPIGGEQRVGQRAQPRRGAGDRVERVLEVEPERAAAHDVVERGRDRRRRPARRHLHREVRRASGTDRDAEQVDRDRQVACQLGVGTARARRERRERTTRSTTPSEWARHRRAEPRRSQRAAPRATRTQRQRRRARRDLDARGTATRAAPRSATPHAAPSTHGSTASRSPGRPEDAPDPEPGERFEAEPHHQADTPDPGGDQRGDRAGSTMAENARYPSGAAPTTTADRRAWADSERASATASSRWRNDDAKPVDGIGGPPTHGGGDGQRAGRRPHPGGVVIDRPTGERVGEGEPELRAHVHAPEIGRDRAVAPRRCGRPRPPPCPHPAAPPRPVRGRRATRRRTRARAANGRTPGPRDPRPRPRAPRARPAPGPARPRATPPRPRRCPSIRLPPRASTTHRRRAGRRPTEVAHAFGHAPPRSRTE